MKKDNLNRKNEEYLCPAVEKSVHRGKSLFQDPKKN